MTGLIIVGVSPALRFRPYHSKKLTIGYKFHRSFHYLLIKLGAFNFDSWITLARFECLRIKCPDYLLIRVRRDRPSWQFYNIFLGLFYRRMSICRLFELNMPITTRFSLDRHGVQELIAIQSDVHLPIIILMISLYGRIFSRMSLEDVVEVEIEGIGKLRNSLKT